MSYLAAAPSPAAVRHVLCHLGLEVSGGAVLALQVAPAASAGDILDERLDVTIDGRPARPPVAEVATEERGRIHVIQAGTGTLAVSYRASIRPAPAPAHSLEDATATLPADGEAIVALRQSRYVPSDALAGFAAVELAGLERGPALARSVAGWVFERLVYEPGSSGPLDTAVDTLLSGVGACRDFAHLTIALCRALGVPARLVSAYAPGLSPMDFHAVVEARRGMGWEVLDPTRLAPRSSLTRIATGRDAADTAFVTTLRGQAMLTASEISAVVDGDLPADDHRAPLSLA